MKNNVSLHFIALAIASLVATVLSFITGRGWAYCWGEFEAALPTLTVFATTYGYLGPLLCSLASVVGAVMARRRPTWSMAAWPFFTGIAIAELLMLSLVCYWCVLPVFKVTPRVG